LTEAQREERAARLRREGGGEQGEEPAEQSIHDGGYVRRVEKLGYHITWV
jgi:hypothetical protein